MNFLRQRIKDFIPNGNINNILNIKFEYLARISVIVDVSNLLPDGEIKNGITSIENVRLEYTKLKYSGLRWIYDDKEDWDDDDWDDDFNCCGDEIDYPYEEVALYPKSANFLNNRMQYRVDFGDIFRIGEWGSIFYADVKVNDHADITRTIKCELRVKRGHMNTFVLKPIVCGAYTGQNNTNFREFMCKAPDDYSEDLTTTKGYNSYQWGSNMNSPYSDVNFSYYEKGDVWTEKKKSMFRWFQSTNNV